MRYRTALLVTLFVLPALNGCTTEHGKDVIAIEKTGTYHRPDCPLVNMAKTKMMTVAQAKADHLKPCPQCKPDTI